MQRLFIKDTAENLKRTSLEGYAKRFVSEVEFAKTFRFLLIITEWNFLLHPKHGQILNVYSDQNNNSDN